MKRVLVGAIAVILLCVGVLSLGGCTPAPEDDVIAALYAELVPKSYEVNDIVYGAGLPHDEGRPHDAVYSYLTADCAYKTPADIEALIREVYTTEYADEIVKVCLTGYSHAGDMVAARYLEYEGELVVNTEYKGYDTSRRLDLSSMRIVKKTGKVVRAEFASTLGGEVSDTITVELRRDGDVWKLNSPTY